MSGNARFAAGAILAADGQGTNIISNMKSATFTIRSSAQQSVAPSPAQARPVAAAPSSQQIMPVTQTGVLAQKTQEDGIVKPDAPSLAEYPRSISIGSRIYLKGTSDSDTPIKVYLQYGDNNSPKTEKLMSAADGSFAYASDEIMRPGIYYVWVQEERGSVESDSSRIVKIEVQASGLSASVQEAAALLDASIPFLVILAFFGLFIAYFLHRHAPGATHSGNHIG